MTDSDRGPREARALGAFYGLAVGDALGMPTQSLPRALIAARYGPLLAGFHAAPDDQPLAAGLPAGHVTDDTEQAVLLAQLLVDGAGRFDEAEWARRLLQWEHGMRVRGSLDLLGPSTRRALTDLTDGADPATAGRFGDTNGAAMRITPVALANPASDSDRLLAAVVEVSAVTHHTGVALAGAAAVAGAVSAGVDGASLLDATGTAVAAARTAEDRGFYVAAASVSERIGWAVDTVPRAVDPDDVDGVLATLDVIGRLVGTSLRAQESVPAAFACVHAAGGDPWLAVRIAASAGGDTDTVGAMAGAIAGSVAGIDAWPVSAVELVKTVNSLDLLDLVDRLLVLREQ